MFGFKIAYPIFCRKLICFHLIHKTRRRKEEITLPNHDDEYDTISIYFYFYE
jgi:hypothetical protein